MADTGAAASPTTTSSRWKRWPTGAGSSSTTSWTAGVTLSLLFPE
jgi:hypothetical protein